ncbi:hypothetical protein MSAN_00641100 [Mycena sanguinolenta]|uniref:Uncharacterized protein n=1 Tax=Mycena sanguinolenta TaxID=230812 RepID=A0A8H6YZX1_9AGAR|nr:hypothetical protein MSAN_00641100 [Mycena sanguinolenta]
MPTGTWASVVPQDWCREVERWHDNDVEQADDSDASIVQHCRCHLAETRLPPPPTSPVRTPLAPSTSDVGTGSKSPSDATSHGEPAKKKRKVRKDAAMYFLTPSLCAVLDYAKYDYDCAKVRSEGYLTE